MITLSGSLYYCLLAPHSLYMVLFLCTSRSWWIAHSTQRQRRVATPATSIGSGVTTSTSTCTLFLLEGSIYQHNFPAEGLQVPPSSLGKLCLFNSGVEEFPPIIQLSSVRTTELSRRDASNIQGISFGFLDQSTLFSLWMKWYSRFQLGEGGAQWNLGHSRLFWFIRKVENVEL